MRENMAVRICRLMKKYQPINIYDLHKLYCIEYNSGISYDSFRQLFWKLSNSGLCKVVKEEKVRFGVKRYYVVVVDDEVVWAETFKGLFSKD